MKKILIFIFCLAQLSMQPVLAERLSSDKDNILSNIDFAKINESNDSNKEFVRIQKQPDRAKFAYKGELLFGTTLSYGKINSNNSEVLILLDGIDASAKYSSIKPFVGYFYKDNRCVGFRFGNTNLTAELGGADFNMGSGSDIAMEIPYFKSVSKGYTYGLFHRSYIGLDKKGTFGLFAEVELMHSYTKANTSFDNSGMISTTKSENKKLELGFNPGAAVYIMPNVCTTLSFGFGGVNYNSVKQFDSNGELIGSRNSSKLSLNFNVTAINIGVSIHLW